MKEKQGYPQDISRDKLFSSPNHGLICFSRFSYSCHFVCSLQRQETDKDDSETYDDDHLLCLDCPLHDNCIRTTGTQNYCITEYIFSRLPFSSLNYKRSCCCQRRRRWPFLAVYTCLWHFVMPSFVSFCVSFSFISS